jgi:hypothetical protein
MGTWTEEDSLEGDISEESRDYLLMMAPATFGAATEGAYNTKKIATNSAPAIGPNKPWVSLPTFP